MHTSLFYKSLITAIDSFVRFIETIVIQCGFELASSNSFFLLFRPLGKKTGSRVRVAEVGQQSTRKRRNPGCSDGKKNIDKSRAGSNTSVRRGWRIRARPIGVDRVLFFFFFSLGFDRFSSYRLVNDDDNKLLSSLPPYPRESY